jgi:hypothetical protein
MAMQTLPRQLPQSFDVMDMLRQHVPLTLFVDMAFPSDLRQTDAVSFA